MTLHVRVHAGGIVLCVLTCMRNGFQDYSCSHLFRASPEFLNPWTRRSATCDAQRRSSRSSLCGKEHALTVPLASRLERLLPSLADNTASAIACPHLPTGLPACRPGALFPTPFPVPERCEADPRLHAWEDGCDLHIDNAGSSLTAANSRLLCPLVLPHTAQGELTRYGQSGGSTTTAGGFPSLFF
jgi:hypothetical protein